MSYSSFYTYNAFNVQRFCHQITKGQKIVAKKKSLTD